MVENGSKSRNTDIEWTNSGYNLLHQIWGPTISTFIECDSTNDFCLRMLDMVVLAFARKGFFIVLDGIDGCGKTVHSKMLCEELRNLHYDAAYTTEPSKSPIGQFIGQKLLRETKVAPQIEALLFAADRFQHLTSEIIPMLDTNKIVVSDSYVYSSLAYLGAQGVELVWIKQMNHFAIRPDLALYLDVPPEIGLARKRSRSTLENPDLEKKVRQVYLDLVKSGELVQINSHRNLSEVKKEVIKTVLQSLDKAHFQR
jgi:dTMP kinase